MWTLDDGSSTSVRVVYNHDLDAWTTDTCTHRATANGLVYDGTNARYVFGESTTNSSYYVMRDTTAWGVEGASTYVAATVTTPWIRLNTVQGWQRVRKLLLLLDPAVATTGMGIDISVSYDYGLIYYALGSFSAGELAAAGSQIEAHLAQQLCEAVSFSITTTGTAGTAGHLALRSLVLEAGIRPTRTNELNANTARK